MSVLPRVTWFTEEARERIVAEAIRILDEIGVFVENAEANALLDGAGAEVGAARVLVP
ncbi:MAG: trimethylamine methyltransferase family protein, partial [Planctomycetota bacterium]